MKKQTTEIGNIVFKTSGYEYTEVEFFKKLSSTKYQKLQVVTTCNEKSQYYGTCVAGEPTDEIITSRKQDFRLWEGTLLFWSSAILW